MKTKLLLVALFSLLLSLSQTLSASTPNTWGGDPEIKVVVGAKRIWLVADEISVKCLTVQVQNEQGKVVMEKYLSSKVADWSLNIESLPNGKYSVVIGGKKMQSFHR
jgi:hypothetical protein